MLHFPSVLMRLAFLERSFSGVLASDDIAHRIEGQRGGQIQERGRGRPGNGAARVAYSHGR